MNVEREARDFMQNLSGAIHQRRESEVGKVKGSDFCDERFKKVANS